jgi:hypothetical protein
MKLNRQGASIYRLKLKREIVKKHGASKSVGLSETNLPGIKKYKRRIDPRPEPKTLFGKAKY